MDIKINRKTMTEQEQREAYIDLLNLFAEDGVTIKSFTDKAMEICKNEPEVESVEIPVLDNTLIYNDKGVMAMLINKDLIKEIQAIQL